MFWKPNLPAQKQVLTVRMVAQAPEEDDYPPPAEQSGCEEIDSGESYAATEEQAISTVEDGVSKGDLKAVFRVATDGRHDRKMFPLWEGRPPVQRPRVPNV